MPADTGVRTALVTGASRGIGRAIAVALGGIGYRVAINYNANADAARECAELVKQAGGEAHIVQADIAKPDDHRRLVESTVEKFGDIHLLVNNAGIAPRVRADLLEVYDTQSFDELIHTNLRGPYLLTVLVANRMVTQVKQSAADPNSQGFRGPQIVNVTSISAYTASVNRGDYCISKAGLAMMTQLFAARLAEFGINVYEVRPGIIATDMTALGTVKARYDKLILEEGLLPLRRWGQPEDVGKAVVAIASGLLPYSTGQVLDVDGGFHVRRL